MIPLLNAIYDRFTADATLTTAFPGGLFRDRAPEGTTMPYVVSRVAASKTSYAYSGGSRTQTQVRLSAYGIGHDAVGALAETLAAKFDSSPLTLAAGTNDAVERQGDPVPALLSHDAQGNDVWEWSVTLEYGVTMAG